MNLERTNSNDTFLGIDLGTSSVKILLLDANGKSLGEAKNDYPMLGTEVGLFEQSPQDWINAIISAMKLLRESAPKGAIKNIKAIGLSAQMPTLVIAPKQKENASSIGNAILWCDSRADDYGVKLLSIWGEERYYNTTGIILDGRYIIPMYQWVCDNNPLGLEKPHYILSAKDYLHLWLSGEAVTDPSTASGFGIYSLIDKNWDKALCNEAGIVIESLPRILESSKVSGYLKVSVATALGLTQDIPIVVGAADSVAGVLGIGAMEPGTVCQIWGSSTAIIGVTNKPLFSQKKEYFITPLSLPGTYGIEADILSTGATGIWMTGLLAEANENISGIKDLNISSQLISQIAQSASAGSDGILFYPYLSGGEQGVLWDPFLSGSILGLSTRHKLSHILRAMLEGTCFETKRCMEAFIKGGFELKQVLCTGPTTRDAFFMQILSNILGLECIAVADENGSSFGAAYLAGLGVSAWSLKDLTEITVVGSKRYSPDQEAQENYQNYYEKYIATSHHAKVCNKL